MRATRRLALLGGLLITLAAPSGARAQSWVALSSGTTDDISAIAHVDEARVVFTTTAGGIFVGGGVSARVASFPGRRFSDVAISRGGVALAVADGGRLYRSEKPDVPGSWAQVDLAGSTYNSGCSGTGAPYAMDAAPTADLVAVAWSEHDTAWVVSAQTGQILRSEDAGRTWEEAGQQPDGSCRIRARLTDVAAAPGGQGVYFVSDDFAEIWHTADDLAGDPRKGAAMVVCSGVRMRLAVDLSDPRLLVAAGACPGFLHMGFSADWGASSAFTPSGGGPIRDVATAAQGFLAVGDDGKIEVLSRDGAHVVPRPAPGDLADVDWRAVSVGGANNAVIGGAGGVLAVSSLRIIPPADAIPPTVVDIDGPSVVSAGERVTYTAVAVDEPGGSGVHGAGFRWLGPGATHTTAGSTAHSFATPGRYVIRVTARDRAGNVSAPGRKTVTVTPARPGVLVPRPIFPAADQPPLRGGAATRKGRHVVLRVRGRLGRPSGVGPKAGCRGRLMLSVHHRGRRLAAATATISPTCAYRRTLRIRRATVAGARRVRLRIAFPGTWGLGPHGAAYRVKVR